MKKKNAVNAETFYAVDPDGGDELSDACLFFYDKAEIEEAYENGDIGNAAHIMQVQIVKHFSVEPKFEMIEE
jgi:hypothetical protein